jgi:phospholipid transport system substrate-binding protein
MSLRAAALVIALIPALTGATGREVVESFHGALLETMRLGADYPARLERLGPAVDAAFDVPTIAKVSLGATWRTLGLKEQEQFVALLRDLVVSTYADRFERDSGQTFETLSEASPRPGRELVKTRLVRRTGELVTLDYYLSDGRIYDIVADGVSDLSLRRADYAAIVEREGFAGLLAEIRATIAEHRSGDDAS